jgi:hypothetical protein
MVTTAATKPVIVNWVPEHLDMAEALAKNFCLPGVIVDGQLTFKGRVVEFTGRDGEFYSIATERIVSII